MKSQQIYKLYNKLTPHEQASLVFEAVTRKDNNEADMILECVKRRIYSMPDLDYQQRMQGFSNLSGVYAMVYWKTLFLLSTSLRTHLNQDILTEATQRYIKTLNSIEVALTTICEQLNIEASTIKLIAECSDFDPEFGDEIDDQIVEYYQKLFASIAYLG